MIVQHESRTVPSIRETKTHKSDTQTILKRIAQMVVRLRIEYDGNRSELARKLGLVPHTLRRWEKLEVEPSISSLINLGSINGLSFSELCDLLEDNYLSNKIVREIISYISPYTWNHEESRPYTRTELSNLINKLMNLNGSRVESSDSTMSEVSMDEIIQIIQDEVNSRGISIEEFGGLLQLDSDPGKSVEQFREIMHGSKKPSWKELGLIWGEVPEFRKRFNNLTELASRLGISP